MTFGAEHKVDVKPDNILVSLRDPAAVVEEHLTNTQVVMHRTMSHSSHKPKFIVQSQPIPLDLTKCTEDPTVTFKLADFGVCELSGFVLRQALLKTYLAMFVGKPKYDVIYPPALRPPESLLGAPWGTEADIWALGCIVRLADPNCNLHTLIFLLRFTSSSPDDSCLTQLRLKIRN